MKIAKVHFFLEFFDCFSFFCSLFLFVKMYVSELDFQEKHVPLQPIFLK